MRFPDVPHHSLPLSYFVPQLRELREVSWTEYCNSIANALEAEIKRMKNRKPKPVKQWKPLTDTKKVIHLMKQGLSNDAIAQRTDVKVKTSTANLRQIRRRTIAAGLLPPAKPGQRDTP